MLKSFVHNFIVYAYHTMSLVHEILHFQIKFQLKNESTTLFSYMYFHVNQLNLTKLSEGDRVRKPQI